MRVALRWMATVAALATLAACHRQPEPPRAAAAEKAGVKTGVAAKSVSHTPAEAPRLARWHGVSAPADQWPASVAADVLVLASAPSLDPSAVDLAIQPVAKALRGLVGVELVVARALPGEARVVVRFGEKAQKGPAAVDAVLAAWQAAAPAGLTPPRAEAIGRGARALAALESVAMGGRVEATHYADAHAEALIQAAPRALRSHVAGAVRPFVALRIAPAVLASSGVALNDVVDAVQTLLARTVPANPPPAIDAVRAALQGVTVNRQWTENGGKQPPVPLDRLVDISVEQGEPTREARHGHLPTTFWLFDGIATQSALAMAAPLQAVAAASKEVFRPTVQTLGTVHRMVIDVPEGKEPESVDELAKRFLALREAEPSIVAINAISGHDGIPEALDTDARAGRCWTVWVSATQPTVPEGLFAAGEALRAGGWDVHVLSEHTDTALAWVLNAWGTGGALISAEDPAVLAPNVGRLAEKALVGRQKAGMRQGPQPMMAPLSYRRVDAKALLATQLTPVPAQQFVTALIRLIPLGWWHETPVWLGMPFGEMAAKIGETPLNWHGTTGSGPNHAWLANDVLRVADPTPLVERVRVNGHPALWAVPELYADEPASVSASFWRLVEATVDMPLGMRVEPLDLTQKALVTDIGAERPAP